MPKQTIVATRSLTGTAPKRKVFTREESMLARKNREDRPRYSQADKEFEALTQHITRLTEKRDALKGQVVTREERRRAREEQATKPKGPQDDVSNVSPTPRNR